MSRAAVTRWQRVMWRSARGGFVREVLLVAGAMLLYFGIRNLTAGNADAAFRHGDDLFAVEQWLGVAWESTAQGLIIGSGLLVTLVNWVYIFGHWPVILTAAVVLYVLRRSHFYLLRNAIFISGAIGFAFFAFLPVAPPRLLDLGVVDTVSEHSSAYRALQPPGLTNQYAAFPSFHAGWNLLVGIVLFAAFSHTVLRVIAILSPATMALAVVLTGNHFLLDVAAGYAIVLVGLGAALLLERRGAATLRHDELDRESDRQGGQGQDTARHRTSRRQPT